MIEDRAKLERRLGFCDLVMYGLAYIAPIAPFSSLGFVWDESGGRIALAYLVGALCMICTALSYAMMTREVPTAGSVYGFARHALGPVAGFMAGWFILLDYLLIPAYVYVFISVALCELLPQIGRAGWIAILVLVCTAINWRGIAMTARFNIASVIFQLVIVFGAVGLAIEALSRGEGAGRLDLSPLLSGEAGKDVHLFTAVSICVASFLGFDAISTLAEEARDRSGRTVARAVLATLLIATLIFIILAWVFGDLMRGFVPNDPAAASYELISARIGRWAAISLAWSYALVIGFTNVLPMQASAARVLFAMARDAALSKTLAKVHMRNATPAAAMLASTAVSLAVALIFRSRLDQLALIVNFGALTGFLFLHASVMGNFLLAKRSRDWIAHALVPLVGTAVTIAILTGMDILAALVGLSWGLIGLARARSLTIRPAPQP